MLEMSMSKLGTAIGMLAVPCLLMGFAVGADASAAKPARSAANVKVASSVEAIQAAPASVTAPPAAQAAAAPAASVPACARKVKVIYAGYGEADRAGCSVASAATTP